MLHIYDFLITGKRIPSAGFLRSMEASSLDREEIQRVPRRIRSIEKQKREQYRGRKSPAGSRLIRRIKDVAELGSIECYLLPGETTKAYSTTLY